MADAAAAAVVVAVLAATTAAAALALPTVAALVEVVVAVAVAAKADAAGAAGVLVVAPAASSFDSFDDCRKLPTTLGGAYPLDAPFCPQTLIWGRVPSLVAGRLTLRQLACARWSPDVGSTSCAPVLRLRWRRLALWNQPLDWQTEPAWTTAPLPPSREEKRPARQDRSRAPQADKLA